MTWMTRERSGKLAALLAVTLSVGCASLTVNTFTAREFEPQRYRSFTWSQEPAAATGDPRLDNNEFVAQRIRTQVEQALTSKGFEKAPSSPSDLLVHYHASVSQEIDMRLIDRKYQVRDEEEAEPFVFDAGTIIIDLVEFRTNRLVWRGWAEGSIEGLVDDQMWLEKRIDEAVAQIMRRLSR